MSAAPRLLLAALCLVLAGAVRAEDWSAWQRAYDAATRVSFLTYYFIIAYLCLYRVGRKGK